MYKFKLVQLVHLILIMRLVNDEVEFSIEGLPNNTNINFQPSNKFVISQDGTLSIELGIDESTPPDTYPIAAMVLMEMILDKQP